MKEFVEKLIERLEENIEELSGWNHHKVNAYSNAVRIVKQLAEEYNPSKSSGLSEPYKPEEKPQTNFYVERFNRVN